MPSAWTKPPIFISHASDDREIVTKLIDALNNGLHLPGETFFCSSVPGMGIPNGKRFIDYIRETIDETKLVIFLISPAFLESRFCLAESGAAWVKSVDQIILLMPSLKPEDLGGVFDGIQAKKLSDQYALNELKDRICNAVSPRPQVNSNHWERVRNEFLSYVDSLPPPNLESSVKQVAAPQSAQLQSPSPDLTPDARRLLVAASEEHCGFISASSLQGGRSAISIGAQYGVRMEFAQFENEQSQSILDQLETSGLIEPLNWKKSEYKITAVGIKIAGLLRAQLGTLGGWSGNSVTIR